MQHSEQDLPGGRFFVFREQDTMTAIQMFDSKKKQIKKPAARSGG